MKTALHPQIDIATRAQVESEINWTAEIVDPAEIAVAVHDGVVTLTGRVPSYVQKVAAGKAALRTRGVTAVANDILVTIGARTDDSALAERAAHVLSLNGSLPAGSIHVQVTGGVVTLTGVVPWNFQRDAARKSVSALAGIKDVVNNITLEHRASSVETKAHIRSAFQRLANLDANKIDVTVDGTTVTLSGTVSSNSEKWSAANAAWHSPNVFSVVNDIHVAP